MNTHIQIGDILTVPALAGVQLHGPEGCLGQRLDAIRRKFVNGHEGHSLWD
jgi:hypothetical protein